MKLKIAMMATLAVAFMASGCGSWNVGEQGTQSPSSSAAVRDRLPFTTNEAELARLVGHRADGMRYVLKVEDGGDTLECTGTIGGQANCTRR